MLNLGRGLSRLLLKTLITPYKIPLHKYYFVTNKTLNASHEKIRKMFKEKGMESKQYQQEMGKAMREALSKHNNQQAVQLQLFHLNLVKESSGQTSEAYRNELRQISKFFINNMQFENAAKLIQELQSIQKKMQNISPLDTVSTKYLLGYVYMELGKLKESKQCLYECLNIKHVQEAPEVYFKVYSQLARVHSRSNQLKQALQKLQKCQQILNTRQISENAPPFVRVMDLHDVFTICQLASIMSDKTRTEKNLQLYQKRLQKCSNKKDPIYAQFLERNAKIYFNLKQFDKAIGFLEQGIKLCQQLSQKDKRFQQNIQILKSIIEFIKKQHIK